MKLQKLKKYFNLGILVIGISFLFSSCEREIAIEDISNQSKIGDIVGAIIEGNALSNEHELVLKTLSNFNKSTESTSRTVYVSEYDFVIDTLSALKLETSSFSSYTFQIWRDNHDVNFLENYVLTIYPDDSYQQYLVKYPILESGVYDKENAEHTYIESEKLVSRGASCTSFTTEEFVTTDDCIYVNCRDVGGHAYGDTSCTTSPEYQAYKICSGQIVTMNQFSCSGDSGSSSGGESPSGGTTDSATSPYSTYSPANLVISALGYSVSSNEAQWLYTHNNDEAIFMRNFLDDPIITGDKVGFSRDYIELSMLVMETLSNEEIETFFEFNQDYKNRMSDSERVIFDSMSKYQQFTYLYNAHEASVRAENLFPDSLHNGKGDAFRHAYFSALNTTYLGIDLAKRLADAHEEKPFSYSPEYKEKEMDLFNNEVGRSLSNWFSDGFRSQEDSILDAMYHGNLMYLSDLEGGASSGKATYGSDLTPTSN